ncbi:LIM and senescent cell antigen-like-containing domain protein 1 isoform X2 [Gordionus sp. m RMFG-2023]|uniref:LIM and senescent cell antigen-like-containing domain protein 1 isoform X2 n=1 Tax=Gordionus sp. m RMFG-2023 TaxID=3053472 RepID=UPI0031FD319E
MIDQYLPMKTMCVRCGDGFETDEKIVNTNGELWHQNCFVCAQCFRPFPEGIFYEYEGRKYCEHDFHVLFAPCCSSCGEFIVGRVIKAMNSNWHPECFTCNNCQLLLADVGFVKIGNKALCKECSNKEKIDGQRKMTCHKCKSIIDEPFLLYQNEPYHPYHFNCKSCEIELNADAREYKTELYCLKCYDRLGAIPICGACRRPIEEARVVRALGKTWHPHHFVCGKCERPFHGSRHYTFKGVPYCETHYHALFGSSCFRCDNIIAGDAFAALNKSWCPEHFSCFGCDVKMNQKSKFFEIDLKPVCKKCYERLPSEFKKRLTNNTSST